MEEPYLYRQIAESLRRQILSGELVPGDRLPTIRELTKRWVCTPGTIQKAYQELGNQGLIVSRPGQGTHVAGTAPSASRGSAPLRWANLVHRAETYLLEVLTAGYTPTEAEDAVREALDRWRTVASSSRRQPSRTLRFVGSHDPAIAWIVARAEQVLDGAALQATFTGSLGGLIALARGEADLAGSHLWDRDTDTYNTAFVQRLLPGRKSMLLTLAHRRLGLIVAPGNPRAIQGLEDLTRDGIRIVNRQRGSGTRVWLDARLHRKGILTDKVVGYDREANTHGEVAHIVASGEADVGLGVEAAALPYHLGFVPLAKERYDIVMLAETWEWDAVESLAAWLVTDEAKSGIEALGGYDVAETGRTEWVEQEG